MSDTPARKAVWIPNKPEQRLSIAVDRLLDRCLLQPCYASAQHDADEGGRNDNQRARDANRGMKPGQLDWDVAQGPPLLWRKLELKRGKNPLSVNQLVTVAKLSACGGPPIVARTLREVWEGLTAQGFRFSENVRTVLVELEAHLAGWDRTAEALKTGVLIKKKSRSKKPEPRYLMKKTTVSRARRAGIFI